RPLPQRLPARRLRIRRHDAVALLCHPYAAGSGRDHRADRGAPVPRHQARHHRAAVAESARALGAARGGGLVNQSEKEHFLRESGVLKAQGKPFFPYAVTKDAIMACIVMAVIIAMSLVLGAELGSKANPTTTTYVPRPEWYFFFLFEVLRVVK